MKFFMMMMVCVMTTATTAMATPPTQTLIDAGQDVSVKKLEDRADVNDVVDAGQDASLGELEAAKAAAELKLKRIQSANAKSLRSIRARLDILNDMKLSKSDYERLSKAARAEDSEAWKSAVDDLDTRLSGQIMGLTTRIETLEADVAALKVNVVENSADIETLMKRRSFNIAPIVQSGFTMYTGGSVQGGIELTVAFGENTMGRIGGAVGAPFSGEKGLAWSTWISVMHRFGNIVDVGGSIRYDNFDTLGEPGVKALALTVGPEIDFHLGVGFRAFIVGGFGYGTDHDGPEDGFAASFLGGVAWDVF